MSDNSARYAQEIARLQRDLDAALTVLANHDIPLEGLVAQPLKQAEEIAVLREQLAVATRRAQRFRDTLLRLAARADDYSAPDIRAHVADALEVTVKELEAMVEDDA